MSRLLKLLPQYDLPCSLNPARARADSVPVNPGQRAAVAGLRGGLGIIHGPPGTGKSTTIFHVVEARVQPRAQVTWPAAARIRRGALRRCAAAAAKKRRADPCPQPHRLPLCCLLPALMCPATHAQVLVTCSRNQAVDAVVGKLARVEGSLLVFGREERLGDTAKRFRLEARLARHPNVRAWLECVERLQGLQKRLQNGELAPGEAAAEAAAGLAAALPPPGDGAGGWRGAPAEHLAALGVLQQKAQQVMRLERGGRSSCRHIWHLCCLSHSLRVALLQGGSRRMDAQILQPAISCLLVKVLPAVKARAEKEILSKTRWVRRPLAALGACCRARWSPCPCPPLATPAHAASPCAVQGVRMHHRCNAWNGGCPEQARCASCEPRAPFPQRSALAVQDMSIHSGSNLPSSHWCLSLPGGLSTLYCNMLVLLVPAVQVRVDIDTVVVDEAGCVAEMALPTLIRLAPANLVLVGDHLQLPAYTDLVAPPPNHTRRCAVEACRLRPYVRSGRNGAAGGTAARLGASCSWLCLFAELDPPPLPPAASWSVRWPWVCPPPC